MYKGRTRAVSTKYPLKSAKSDAVKETLDKFPKLFDGKIRGRVPDYEFKIERIEDRKQSFIPTTISDTIKLSEDVQDQTTRHN